MVKDNSDIGFTSSIFSDEFVGFYFQPAIDVHLLITLVCTCGAWLSQKVWRWEKHKKEEGGV